MRSGLAVQRKGFASFPLVQVDEIQDRLLKLLDGVVDAAPEPSSAFVKVGDGNAISWLRYRSTGAVLNADSQASGCSLNGSAILQIQQQVSSTSYRHQSSVQAKAAATVWERKLTGHNC